MDQSTPSKPVMDVTPPKPAEPATSAKDTTPAALPPTDADSGGLPSANPSLAQVDSRTAPVAGGTDGGAPGAPQPSGEHDGEASMSDRTRTEASELVGGSTGEASASDRTRTPGAGAVHAAPPLSDDDKPAEAPKQDDMPAQMPASSAHTAPKSHGPAAAITFVVFAMILLSALAILVYLNS